MIKLLKQAVFSSRLLDRPIRWLITELSTQVMAAKLTLIDVYQEDLLLLEESVKAAETHEAISVFQQFKNPMVSSKRLCYQLSCVISQLYTCTCVCIRLSVRIVYCLENKPFFSVKSQSLLYTGHTYVFRK